jgi:hypothetical protein
MGRGGEKRNRCEGVGYVGKDRDLKYITHDGVEILTSKRREATR